MTSSARTDTAPRHRREPVPRRSAHRVMFAFVGGAAAAVVVAGVATDLTRTPGDVPAANTEVVDPAGPGAAPSGAGPGAPVLPAAAVITSIPGADIPGAPIAGAPGAGGPGAGGPGVGGPVGAPGKAPAAGARGPAAAPPAGAARAGAPAAGAPRTAAPAPAAGRAPAAAPRPAPASTRAPQGGGSSPGTGGPGGLAKVCLKVVGGICVQVG